MLLIEHPRRAATALNRTASINSCSVRAASQRALDSKQWDYAHCFDKSALRLCLASEVYRKHSIHLRKLLMQLWSFYVKYVKMVYPLVGELIRWRQSVPKLSAELLVVHFGSIRISTFIRNNDTAMPW